MRRLTMLLLALALVTTACARGPEELPAPQGEEGRQEQPLPPVHSDPEPLYTRYYQEETESLRPAEDYGTLYAYAGRVEEDPLWGSLYRYGLATADGVLVTDPAYQSVSALRYRDGDTGQEAVLPVLRLGNTREDGAVSFTLAARDGSWVAEEEAVYCAAVSPTAFLLQDMEGIYHVYDVSGQRRVSFLLEGEERYFEIWRDGVGVCCDYSSGDYALVDAMEGAVTPLENVAQVSCWSFGEGLLAACNTEGFWGYLDQGGRWAFPPTFLSAEPFQYGFAAVTLGDGTRVVMDSSGRILTYLQEGEYPQPVTLADGERAVLIGSFQGASFTARAAYDSDWNRCGWLEPGLQGDIYGVGMLQTLEDGSYRWVGEEESFTLPEGVVPGVVGSCLVSYGDNTAVLRDRHGRECIGPGVCGSFYEITDAFTGESYIVGSPPDGQSQAWYLCDSDGQLLLTLLNEPDFREITVQDGLVQYCGDGMVTLLTLNGEAVFRYPLVREGEA